MSAFVYGVALQLKLDIRSKTMLVSCYFIPLIFFLFMGGIFTSVMPGMKNTLIQSMIVMGVSMGSFTGLPLTLAETCGDGIKKVYKANGVPLYMGLVTMFISAFIHLAVMCMVLLLLAPVIFGAAMPANLPVFFVVLAVYIAVSLSVGSILGLAVKNQAKLSMVSQLVFSCLLGLQAYAGRGIYTWRFVVSCTVVLCSSSCMRDNVKKAGTEVNVNICPFL